MHLEWARGRPGRRRSPAGLAALSLVLAAAVAGTASGARIAAREDSTAECGPGGAGAGIVAAGDLRAGPLHVPGPGFRGSHWNPRKRRFAAKFPIVVIGKAPVRVTVPRRLSGRVAFTYMHSPLSREITFVPCPARRASFFPGGLVFSRREPIVLVVRRDGWARPRLLRLGRFHSRRTSDRHSESAG